MKCSVVSVDLAKTIFQTCGLDDERKVLFNKKVKRSALLAELRKIEPTTVVMEACYSSNYWGRMVEKLGHTVLLIPAFIVKPFVIGNKNDHNDALAIAEASLRPTVRFVPIKTYEQQDLQCLQKARVLKLKIRTSIMNQVRGFLSEYGVIANKSLAALMKTIPLALEDGSNDLTYIARELILKTYEQVIELNNEIDLIEKKIISLVKDKAIYRRLQTIPGVGPVIAAAIIAAVNDPNIFKNGRQFASWIGLTPKQHSSGDTNHLGKISKRGNKSLRRLLIHGARAVLRCCDKKQDNVSLWLSNLKKRKHNSKATVAYANKLARIIWAVLAKDEDFNVKVACH